MSLAPFHEIDILPFTDILEKTRSVITKLASGVPDKEKRDLITGLAEAVEHQRMAFIEVVPVGLEQAKSRYESLCQEHASIQSRIREIHEKKAKVAQKLAAMVAKGPTTPTSPFPAPTLPVLTHLDFNPGEVLRAELLGLGLKPPPTAVPLNPGQATTGNIWENWKAHPFGTGGPDPDHGEDHEHDHPSEQ